MLVAYLLHPAPIWEIAGNGHVDAAMMAFLFGSFAWGDASRPYRTAIPMTLGALVKPARALGSSLWRPFEVALPLFVLALAALLYLPFDGAGLGVVGILPHYLDEQGLASGEGFFWLAFLGKAGLAGHGAGLRGALGACGGRGGVARPASQAGSGERRFCSLPSCC